VQYDDDWTTVLWPKVDYMVHLGLRPWWTARCADPPLCGVPRLDAAPLAGCRSCTLVNDTAPVTLESWLHDTAASNDAEAKADAAPWPPHGGEDADDGVAAEREQSERPLPCPSGSNHGCCMLPTSCISGQVR
jgi:hypothetical protein